MQRASVYYRFGESGDFDEQTMFDDGLHGDGGAADGIWSGVIPAGPARTTAYYYVCATDNEAATGCSPADAPEDTYNYLIRSSSLSIFDLQYTANPTGGTSPYLDSIVTVTGIVTGTNFGDSFYMSDPGGGLWSGIYVFGPSLTPALGDCVLVTGQIIEYQDAVTEFASGAAVEVLSSGHTVAPLDSLDGVRGGVMGDSAEAFEGGLVKLGVCWVTSTEDWSGGFPVFEVGDATGRAIIAGDASFEYDPVIGDSFISITGCVDYFSANGWEIAPRFDADLAYIDHRDPQLVSAETVSPREVNLLFNEPLLDSLISDPANYTVVDLTDPEFPALAVESAYLFSDQRTVHVTFFDPLDPEHAYRLTIGQVWDASPNRNSLENAVINFGGYEPGEFTPIATLYDSFDVYNGRTVALRGIVNFVQDVTTTSGSRRISAYMQDESGKGFSLSQSGAAATFPAIQRGNWIRITGVVNQFDGVIQLGSFTGTDAVVLAEHVPLPDPIVINTGDYRTQRRIVRTSDPDLYGAGTWVKSSGTIYRVDENVGGGTNIFFDDGTGNLTIRIWDSMQLDSVELNGEWYLLRELVGKTATVAGPSSTFEGDFQMLAGYAEDFTVETISGVPSASPVLQVPARAFAPDRGQTLRIDYNAPSGGNVRIRIFDLRGRLVTTLVDKPAGGPGMYVWNGRNDLNELVPIGTYILHLESVQGGKSEEQTKPIVVGTKL